MASSCVRIMVVRVLYSVKIAAAAPGLQIIAAVILIIFGAELQAVLQIIIISLQLQTEALRQQIIVQRQH